MKVRILTILVAVAVFIFGAFGGVWAQAFLMPYFASHGFFQHWKFVRDWSERITKITEVREIVIRFDDAAERVASRGADMAVGVEGRRDGRAIGGSGLVVTSDGFILTRASVVPQGYAPWVYLKSGGEPLRAELLKRDAQLDLAILKIDARNLQTAGFASGDSLRLGAPVVMVAKIQEAGELLTIVNQGSVRAKDENLLRTNIFDKSSLGGAPLFNLEGYVVGLSFFEPNGRLVAIPSSILRAFSSF